MPLSIVILFQFLNILLLIPGQQCLNEFNHFTTIDVPSSKLPINLYTTASTPKYFPGTRPFNPSSIQSQIKTHYAQRRLNYPPFRYGRTILPSLPRPQAPITPPLPPIALIVRRRRGLIGDLFSDLGLQASSPSSDVQGTPTRRQATQSPLSVVSGSRLTSTSKLPTPTLAAIPNSTNDSSKSRLPVTSSTITPNAKGTATKSHSSAEHTASAPASQPSQASLNSQDTPQTGLQKLGSYFKSSNRMAPVAYAVTVGLVFGVLVTFVSFLKCLCHRRRFANRKDYPTGFPWVEPNQKFDQGESRRKELAHHTASYISTRNSITPSVNFSRGQLNPVSRGNSYYAEYQLNDLCSPSDVDAHYSYILGENSKENLQKDLSNFSDALPSSSSTEESSQLPLTPSLDLKLDEDRWDMRSINGACHVLRGGASQQEHNNERISPK